MSRSSFLLPILALAAAVGCGSIAGRDDNSIATVSGTLAGGASVPAGARIALVWHSPTGAFVVSHETPVVNGGFSIDLSTAPADDLFFKPYEVSETTVTDNGGTSTSGSPGAPMPTPAPTGAGGSTSGGFGQIGSKLSPRDNVSGSVVSTPMTVAIAGFVLYVDKNGNGKLDLNGDTADSPDQIIGGSEELALTYLRDGTQLDLEKLRDTSGQLPSRGYDLLWTVKKRWVPLADVEITLGVDRLPGDVCYVTSGVATSKDGLADAPVATSGGGSSGSSGPATLDAGVPTDPSSSSSSSSGSVPPSNSYPPKGDPNVKCSPDGTSFSYYTCDPTTPPPPAPPPPTGLCRNDVYMTEPATGGCGGYGASLPTDADGGTYVPDGWPCDVTTVTVDGGPAPDAGK